MWMKRLNNQTGVTLVELLVASLISLIAFAAIYQMYIGSTRTATVAEEVSDMQQNVRVAMDQITRELRLAGYDPLNPGSGNTAITGEISSGTTLNGQTLVLDNGGDTFSFQGDIDNDGVEESVTYELPDDTDPNYLWLMRTEKELPSGTPVTAKFAENITGASFSFYDTHNALTDDVSDIRRVTVTLTGRTAHEDPDFNYKGDTTDHYRKRILSSDVILRNSGKQSDIAPPACPTNVQIDNNTNQCRVIRVTWTAAPDNALDLAGYYIFYSTSPIPAGTDPATLNAKFVNVSNKDQVLKDVSVPDDSNYYFAMTSYDKSGNLCSPVVLSSPSNLPPGTNAAPAGPTNALAIPADNQVTIEWGAVTNESDIKGYRLYRNTTNDFSTASLIADQGLLGQQDTTSGVSATTQYVDNAANTPAPNGGPVNCQKYYYWITTVDACAAGIEPPPAGSMSAPVAVQSLQPDSSYQNYVTPPDNSKSPPTPTITQLVAGDDTSTIIIDWSVNYVSGGSNSLPSQVTILWRPQGTSDWLLTNPNVGHVTHPLDPAGPWPATGEEVENGLSSNTVYEVKVVTEDDAASCSDSTSSAVGTISTAACAPRYRGWDSDPNLLGNKIMPGINSTGTPIKAYDTIGSDPTITPSSNQNQFVTWAVDPIDCTPTSAFFDSPGFDYSNPPAYDIVADNAQVQFYINPAGGGDNPANNAYGTGASGVNTGNSTFPSNSGDNVDHAPRSADGFYHFPVYPLDASHLDTSALCDGDYEFKTLIQDGELYNATNTLPLTIKNGGFGLDGTVAVLSDLNTRQDIHHIVKFGVENTSSTLDYQMNTITLTWTKLSAVLNAVVVKDDSGGVIGKWDYLTGTPAGRQGIGSQITLNPAPVLASGAKGSIELYFSKSDGSLDSTVDMRNGKVTILELEREDVVTGNTCTIQPTGGQGDVKIPYDPEIDPTNIFQDQPTVAFVPTPLVGKTSALPWYPPPDVNISAKLMRVPAVPLDMTKTRLRVQTTADARTLSPPRPNTLGGTTGADGGPWGSFPLSYDSGTNTLTGTIPSSGTVPDSGQALLDRQVWYYFEVVDTDGNFDILPNNYSLLYRDAYTYTTCTGLTYLVSVTSPASGSSQTGTTTATVSVSGTPYAMTGVTFHVNGKGNIPDQTVPMTKISADGVLPQTWTADYSAGSSYLPHAVYATGEDVCGVFVTSAINDIN
jgi:type IV pilus assembly protein PilW